MRLLLGSIVVLGCSSGGAASTVEQDGAPADTGVIVDVPAETLDTTPPPADTSAIDTSMPDAIDAPKGCTEPGSKTLGGRCYFTTDAKSFFDAKTACTAASAHLVTITSEEEHALVGTFATGSDRWIGLERPFDAPSAPDSFKWITGEAVTIQKWGLLEPRARGPCGSLNSTSLWADLECVKLAVAICERD